MIMVVIGGAWLRISTVLLLFSQVMAWIPPTSVLKSHRMQTSTIPFHHRIKETRLNALLPLEVEELQFLLSLGTPTGLQYTAYFGRTPQERYARVVESAVVSLIGMCFSYFLSFVIGGFVATLFGALFLFWGILSPDLKARQRNWEFLGGRQLVDPWTDDIKDAGLYGSLFLGYVEDVCVVEDANDTTEYELKEFQDFTMDTDELERWTGQPYLLRLRVNDSKGRALQVHARLSEDYLGIRQGMPLTGILLSTSSTFDRLAAITDLYIPDAECWVGDYPYLDRNEIEVLLSEDDDIWEQLQAERKDSTEETLEDISGDMVDDTEKVKIRRRRG